jgi:hypothetical protein
VGRSSRFAGVVLIAVGVVLLVLSVYYPLVDFEVDSVVAFLAGVVLLFRDPRARVQARVLDAVLQSETGTIEELSPSDKGFAYVPTGGTVEEVVVVPAATVFSGRPDNDRGLPSGGFTPPGRGLAVLFQRESRLPKLTVDGVSDALQRMVPERLGLANSAEIKKSGDNLEVTLRGASATCGCDSLQGSTKTKGTIGCAVGSLFAVLYSCATKRSVILEGCSHDQEKATWTVKLSLGPAYSEGGR